MLVIALHILGSLGLFIYGMKVMSEGLQKLSGDKLRSIMQAMTRNRLYGIMTGTLVTVSVQSSSATTVMVVGFVNARLLNLRQAIGVIMGANLGTTVTFWLIAFLGFKFSISEIALPVVAIGTVCLFLRNPRTRDLGQFLVGFGLLFLGLSFLKDSIPDAALDADSYAFLQSLTGMGYGSVLLFFVFGIALTITVQSSSAAGAISLALAYKGWISYELSAAIVLGENIGTTITAILASLAGDRQAKRAALAHLLFNVFGVMWALAIFHPYLRLIDSILPGNIANPVQLPEHLALFHTLFNLINICLLVGFVSQLERIVMHLLPERAVPKTPSPLPSRLSYQPGALVDLGELNLIEGQKEVSNLASLAEGMFEGFLAVYAEPEADMSDRVRQIKAMEHSCDQLATRITEYFIQCSAHELSDRSASNVAVLLRVVAELEDTADCCWRLTLLARKRYRKGFPVSPNMTRAISEFALYVKQFLSFVRQCLESDQVGPASMETALQLENTIDATRKTLRKEAIRRMESTGNIRGELIYIDILGQLEKIGNHSLNILQALQRKS